MSESVDVLVLGAGPAGLVAAYEAASAGATVTIVDCTSEIGGNGAFSTGYMAFAGTSRQGDLGIQDSPETFLADMVAEVERKRAAFDPEFDHSVAERFVTESGAAFEFLVGLGFDFGRFVSRPLQHSVDRMVVMTRTADIREIFVGRLGDLGVTIRRRERATSLTTEGGVVRGAILTRPDGTHTEVLARRAVVVTTGGYQASAEMRAQYQPAFDSHAPFQGLDTIVGDGHRMLADVGADLVNMHMVPELVQVASRLVEECIAVNEDGRRFHDEAGPYNLRLAALRAQPGAIAYYLCDAATAERQAQLLGELPGRSRTVGSLEAAARVIGADPRVLVGTVERWNDVVEASAPDEFGRVVLPEDRVGIRKSPFTLSPMVIGTDISAGGARITPDTEVLRADGRVIPNVFAAGDCQGITNVAAGLGGVHLASAVTLGRVAGRAAAGCARSGG
jgi:succinate dehydrogenase/fumarate reductase flavoprotein subunit